MTALVATALAALALCDGMFSGFRSAAGRTGLIRHRSWDVRAHLRGLVVVVVLLVPATSWVLLDPMLNGPAAAVRWLLWRRAGAGMLAVYLPYGLLTLTALAAYATLPWRYRFRAIAVILGPFTLARPWVASAGGAVAAWVAGDVVVGVGVLLAVAGVLLVGRVCDRLWYARLPDMVRGSMPDGRFRPRQIQ
jgi:hypothetical protein